MLGLNTFQALQERAYVNAAVPVGAIHPSSQKPGSLEGMGQVMGQVMGHAGGSGLGQWLGQWLRGAGCRGLAVLGTAVQEEATHGLMGINQQTHRMHIYTAGPW